MIFKKIMIGSEIYPNDNDNSDIDNTIDNMK